ncbi:hypothetical protein AVEN_97842-1 [Araneus ventricosus]|uniref:Uncharacterized protein n=1 Tax=Araneus ventricosus TaxID=182803 RepID=A0A4Y2RP09_ARAVE|nr:hypothetical protein AVEN_97842-1 [Araneus ventricosus]
MLVDVFCGKKSVHGCSCCCICNQKAWLVLFILRIEDESTIDLLFRFWLRLFSLTSPADQILPFLVDTELVSTGGEENKAVKPCLLFLCVPTFGVSSDSSRHVEAEISGQSIS